MRWHRLARRARTGAVTAAALIGLVVLLAALAPFLGMRLVRLETGSMSPGFPTGSVLLVRDADASEAVAGDIVTVRRADGASVTHRVVSTSAAGDGVSLTLKGDANDQVDPKPYLANRVGIVLGGIPWGGDLVVLARSEGAIPLLAGFVSLLVLWAWWPQGRNPAHARRRTEVA
ncbi:signal peptidase I [Homoserinibacter sp. GY 40078]|uniref:signal peptidase I n=1 Tax=Homoserinibacter sp. GY 40078 TaxID=2603275 RepID=UPI001650BA7B|nr:signal peptidase I [Homoserinibacter sp. GY 40078]